MKQIDKDNIVKLYEAKGVGRGGVIAAGIAYWQGLACPLQQCPRCCSTAQVDSENKKTSTSWSESSQSHVNTQWKTANSDMKKMSLSQPIGDYGSILDGNRREAAGSGWNKKTERQGEKEKVWSKKAGSTPQENIWSKNNNGKSGDNGAGKWKQQSQIGIGKV